MSGNVFVTGTMHLGAITCNVRAAHAAYSRSKRLHLPPLTVLADSLRARLRRDCTLNKIVAVTFGVFLLASSPIFCEEPATREKAKPAVAALAVTPDGKGLLVGSQAGVHFRPFDGKDEPAVATKLDHVHALAFSPDGTTLAVAGGSPAENGVVELWSWPARKLLGRLEGHEDLVYAVAWLPGGKALATASADRTVRVWDAGKHRCVETLAGHSGPVLALAVSPDGKLLCSGGVDQTIRVWDAATGKPLRSLNNHLGTVHGLAFRPAEEGKPPVLASAGGDNTVRVWQPAVGRMVRIVRHPAPVYSVVWRADGSGLYSGAKDGVVRLIDADSDAVLREGKADGGWVISLMESAKGKQILAGTSQGEVKTLTLEP